MRIPFLVAMLLFPSSAMAGHGGVFFYTGHTSTRAHVHFIVENEAGQRTGQLLDGTQVYEIPGTETAYGPESHADDDSSGAPGYERVGFEFDELSAGRYKLQILPATTTAYWVDFTVRNDNLSSARLTSWAYAVAGTTATYSFDFVPTASSPTPVAKLVIPAGLRQSVQVALQLGQIGDTAFVSRLDKLLGKAQSEIEKGQNKQAADRLGQFIHRLDSALKKEPDPDDGDDPQDKKNSADMKRFVTQTARDSLSADARTLIIGLGEKPKR